MIRILLILFFINQINSYVFDPFHIINKILCKKNDFYVVKDETVKEVLKFNDYILNHIPKEINYNIFKKMTEMLPELHRSGDGILQQNDKLINQILELDNLNPELKKKMIKILLFLTVEGDHFASNLLEVYKRLVDHMM